jgi:hypothetical protein
MSEDLIFKLLSLGQLLLIPVLAYVVKVNKSLVTMKFYQRKVCDKLEIDCGKDLD